MTGRVIPGTGGQAIGRHISSRVPTWKVMVWVELEVSCCTLTAKFWSTRESVELVMAANRKEFSSDPPPFGRSVAGVESPAPVTTILDSPYWVDTELWL